MSKQHNDKFILSKREESREHIWRQLEKEFLLIFSKPLTDAFVQVKLTYEYLEDLVIFSRTAFPEDSKHRMCIAALDKDSSRLFMQQDLEDCLRKYSSLTNNPAQYLPKDYPLYYIDYQFADSYNCKHGDTYKDVYLVFAAYNEQRVIDTLFRFQKLKAFI